MSLHCRREHAILRKSRIWCKLSRSNTSDIARRRIGSLVPSPVQGSKGQLVLFDRQCFTTKKGKGRCDVGEACLVCVALVVRPKTSGAPNIFVNPHMTFLLSHSPLFPLFPPLCPPPQFAFYDAGRYVSTALLSRPLALERIETRSARRAFTTIDVGSLLSPLMPPPV